MKTFLTLLFIIISSPVFSFSQCENETESTGKILKEIQFSAKNTDVVALKINAGGKNSSWLKKNSEAGALTIFVNGKYNQDVLLFAGEKMFEYGVVLGTLDAGEHKISIVQNKDLSSPLVAEVKLKDARVVFLENSDELEKTAVRNAPVIYARPDTVGRFSDIPLIVYYEILPQSDESSIIRYTAIFTNEDGGTQSAALLARWGRLTDIEWVYEIRVGKDGKFLEEKYQGANHQINKFQGKRVFGSHPLIFNTTVNNNFSDEGCSRLRFLPLPVRARLTSGSRETVMDKFSWTYRIMAEEILREGRVDPKNLGANIIDDPRKYFFVEVESQPENAAVSVEIEGEREKSQSDWNDPRLRVGRTGFVRIAVRNPLHSKQNFPKSLNIRCSAVSLENTGLCRNLRVLKIGRLDKDFNLREKNVSSKPQNIKTSELAKFIID